MSVPRGYSKSHFFLAIVGMLLSALVYAQPCVIPIINNSISIKQAACVNTVATLQGTTPIGGSGTYTYQWEKSTGNCGTSNFLPITGANDRDYAVPAGTDVNDCFRRVVTSGICTSTSNSTKVANSDRSTPVAPTATTTVSNCATPTGTIIVNSPSPASGIFYSIDGTTYTNTTGIFTGLAPGTYNVTVKFPSDCISPIKTVVVGQASTPTGTISPSSATVCAGSSRTLTVSGGTSYQWYRDNVAISGATSNTYPATLAGTYTVDIISGQCRGTASNSSVITVMPLPTGTITPASGTVCPNGSILLSVSGGTSYQWYKDNQIISGATASTYTVTLPGTYTVTIISGGCSNSASNSVVITQGVAPSGFITPASATLCPGSNILLTAVTAGGVNSFQWFKNGQVINNATSATLNVSQAGTYNVIIFNGTCNASSSNIVTIADALPITFTPVITQPNCTSAVGSIVVNGVTGGGSSNYSFSNNNGVSFQPASSFPNLAPATYQLVVKDTAGCISAPRAVTVNAFVSTLAGTAIVGNITCSQGSGTVAITATGGTSPYQYSLNGGSFGNASSFQNLALGAHSVVVKDAAGCTKTVNFSVNQTGSTLQATFTKTDARCGVQNGSVTMNATGGTAPYQYSLNGNAYQSSNIISNLGGGSYKVTTKDAAGCIYDVFFSLTQTGTAPNLVVNRLDTICPLGTSNLTLNAVTTGSDNNLVFTYWKDTAATTVLANPSAVTPGKYFIKATNLAGCSTIKPVLVNKFNFTAGLVTYSGPQVPCIGATMTLTASSGRGYQWYRNDTLIAGATSASYNVTTSGTYWAAISNDTCFVPTANRYTFRVVDCNAPDVFVPTGFTPNKNGENDLLRPIFYKIATLKHFKVYNRWGQVVFQTAEKGAGWDGTLKGVAQPSETYSWMVECTDSNGNIIKKSGKSLLIR